MFPGLKFSTMKLLLAVFACATFLSAYLLVSAAQDQPPQGPGGGRQGGGRFANLTRVSGTIDSISPDSMVIKTDDGKTITVAITSDTRFRKNREEAKISDFAKGDHVMVGAEPGSDSSKLTARFIGAGMGGPRRSRSRRSAISRANAANGTGNQIHRGRSKVDRRDQTNHPCVQTDRPRSSRRMRIRPSRTKNAKVSPSPTLK